MPKNPDSLKCPFCLNTSIEAKTGPTSCPKCDAQIEIDGKEGTVKIIDQAA